MQSETVQGRNLIRNLSFCQLNRCQFHIYYQLLNTCQFISIYTYSQKKQKKITKEKMNCSLNTHTFRVKNHANFIWKITGDVIRCGVIMSVKVASGKILHRTFSEIIDKIAEVASKTRHLHHELTMNGTKSICFRMSHAEMNTMLNIATGIFWMAFQTFFSCLLAPFIQRNLLTHFVRSTVFRMKFRWCH